MFTVNRCVCKKEEIKESDADLDGGDCNAEGEASDPEDNVSLAVR